MRSATVTQDDHRRITAAIRAAEAKTSGEIYCVVARQSDGYFFAAGLVLAIAVPVVGFAVAMVLESWWMSLPLPMFLAAELLALAAALLLIYAFPGLRIRLVPRRWQYHHAHVDALKQFLARNVHVTAGRTGVLIFVSLAEHYAEIIADAGIDAQVGQQDWDAIVAELVDHARSGRLADGFVAAIGRVGALLEERFPVTASDSNELDDHLVEL